MNGFMKAVHWPTLGGRKVELDFLRGIAILLACGWHFNQAPTGVAPLDWLLAPGRLIGWAGVDLFFVLSGFLIGGLLFSEFENEGGFRPGRFLVRRAFKIWPVLYSFILLQLLLRQHPWQSYFFQCLFHVQNYFPTPLSPLWSLAVEEQFYLVFAILYTGVILFAGNLRPMPWLLGAMMLVVLIARSLAVMEHVSSDAMMQTQFRLDALSCGVALRYVHVFHRPLFDRIASYKLPLAALWLTGTYVIVVSDVAGNFMHSLGLTIVYLTAASFIVFCYDMPPAIARSVFVRGLAYIGLFSYAIYVVQYAAVKPSAVLADHLHLTGTTAAIFKLVMTYSGAFVAGVIVTILVERPMLSVRSFLFPQYGLKARQPDLFKEPMPVPVSVVAEPPMAVAENPV